MTIFSTAEEQQREPLEIGGKVLFYPDFALQTAGGDVSVLAPWSSYVLPKIASWISGQNPFSDEALLKLLLAALQREERSDATVTVASGRVGAEAVVLDAVGLVFVGEDVDVEGVSRQGLRGL